MNIECQNLSRSSSLSTDDQEGLLEDGKARKIRKGFRTISEILEEVKKQLWIAGPVTAEGLEAGNDQRKCEFGILRNEILEEVKKQLWLAGPLIAVNLLQKLIQMISLMYVGHLDELSLSAASMANSFVSMIGFSLLVGMASALDTLCGQSYGAKQYHMLGIHMQRAMLVLILLSVPLAIIVANTDSILVAVGQNAAIAAEAGNYAIFLIPSLFAYAILQCQIRFLQTQNIVFPLMIITGFTASLHIFVCWVLLFKSGLGNKGAALANSISYWLNVILLALYVKFSPSCAQTWTGFSNEACHNIISFLRLGVPSASMSCLEFWSFEVLVLLSGILPNPELETSVLSISLNLTSVVWRIPLGLSGAGSIRISNELGAGGPRAARLAAFVVTLMGMGQGILVALVLIFTRRAMGYAYSSEIDVVKYVAALMPILATSNFLDGFQCVLSGILRGCGRQKIGAYVNLGAYYIVGIPSAILLAFVFHMGGKGLWFGIIGGLIVQVSCFVSITIRTNWEIEAKKAAESVYQGLEESSRTKQSHQTQIMAH